MINYKPVGIALLSLLSMPFASAIPLGPTPYLQSSDSPFSGSFSYFHLENFEDHLLNVPGVTASAGGVTSVEFGPSIHDSVDADDGVIDGSGLKGDSFFSFGGFAGISFSFDALILGSLPTHAGLVWTDGAGATTFQAFDATNALLGTIGPVAIADGSVNGETAEDRFFGFSNPAGISRIFVSNTGGGIEIDHLQYGRERTNGVVAVAEPTSLALITLGLAGVGYIRRKKV